MFQLPVLRVPKAFRLPSVPWIKPQQMATIATYRVPKVENENNVSFFIPDLIPKCS